MRSRFVQKMNVFFNITFKKLNLKSFWYYWSKCRWWHEWQCTKKKRPPYRWSSMSKSNSYCKSSGEEVSVRPIPVWWSRRESNPCPRIAPHSDFYSLAYLWLRQYLWHKQPVLNWPFRFSAKELKANSFCLFHIYDQ